MIAFFTAINQQPTNLKKKTTKKKTEKNKNASICKNLLITADIHDLFHAHDNSRHAEYFIEGNEKCHCSLSRVPNTFHKQTLFFAPSILFSLED